MARLVFDENYEVSDFTFILSKKNYEFEGKIKNVSNVRYKCNFNSADELSFTVTKPEDTTDLYYENNIELWDKIVDLKFVYVPELEKCFSIVVSLQDSSQTTKNITGTEAGEIELAQIMLYGIEINTENDSKFIDDGIPTLFYRDLTPYAETSDEYKLYKSTSLLHRVLEKAPHYSIGHVDDSLANLERVVTFSIDGTSIYDFLTSQLATEFNCLVKIDSMTRTINFYDLYYYCLDCKTRSENMENSCSNCNSTNLKYYGTDTTIFINKDNLADTITYETNIDSVKNCFRLSAGDDYMTDTIVSANPSGRYIYYFTDEQRNEMPDELSEKLVEYDTLISKNNDTFIDYSNQIYDLIDRINYLSHSMMPTVELATVNSTTEIEKIYKDGVNVMGNVALNIELTNLVSLTTVTTIVKNRIRGMVKTAYVSVDVKGTSFKYCGTKKDSNGDEYSYGLWYGDVTLTNYSDEDDVSTITDLCLEINDVYPDYVLGELKAAQNDFLNTKDDDGDEIYDIDNLFKVSFDEFKELVTATSDKSEDISRYSAKRLESLADGIKNLMDILEEEDQATDGGELYSYYLDYQNKYKFTISLMDSLNTEIDRLSNEEETLEKKKDKLQESMDLENFLGEDLYKTLCSYKREDSYSNENFVSDGLENDELYKNAKIFLEDAKEELYKSAEKQHTITSDLKNLLLMPEFKELTSYFDVGNWIRVQVENDVYKLRLLSYEISFDDLQTINVEFSDVTKTKNSFSDISSILQSAQSMATNYNYVTKQAEKGSIAHTTFQSMQEEGFNSALYNIKTSDKEEIVIDNHGILCKSYKYLTDDYDDRQLKITKNNIAFTEDNWETLSTAIGQFNYTNPITGRTTQTYGVNAQTLIGELILGSRLGIYSKDDKVEMSFDNNGLVLNTKRYSDENDNGLYQNIFRIEVDGDPVLYVDNEGKLVLQNAEFKEMQEALDQTIKEIQDEFCIYSNNTSLPDNYLTDKDDYLTNSSAKQIWYNEAPKITDDNPYLWQRTKVIYKLSEFEATFSTPYCVNGLKGETGDSIKITEQWIKYCLVTPSDVKNQQVIKPSDDEFTLSEIPTNIPNGSYLWSLSYIKYSNNSSTRVYGVSHLGVNAESVYTWIVYADDLNGTNMSEESYYIDNGEVKYKSYIGIAKDQSTSQDSQDWNINNVSPNVFSWSRFKGTDSETYMWVKYADPVINENGEDEYDTKGKIKILASTLSDSPTYTEKVTEEVWTKTGVTSVGFDEDGVEQFEDKYEYITTEYDSIKYRKYIGIKTSNVEQESSNPEDYEWSLLQGNQGENGSFIWIKYSKYEDGLDPDTKKASFEDYPVDETYIYMGISKVKHDKSESQDEASNLATSYTWKQYIGSDGISFYTWIKYGNAQKDSNGNVVTATVNGKKIPKITTISDTPTYTDSDGNTQEYEYLGISSNRTVSEEEDSSSDNYTEYNWSLIKGKQGDIGLTYYIWIMYCDGFVSDTDTSDLSAINIQNSPSSGTKYMGISYNNLISQEDVLKYSRIKEYIANKNDNSSEFVVDEELEAQSVGFEINDSMEEYLNNMFTSTRYDWHKYVGDNSYMWVKYSKYDGGVDENGVASISDDSTDMKYIGLRFGEEKSMDEDSNSDDPSYYSWKLIQAIDAKTIIDVQTEWCISSEDELQYVYYTDDEHLRWDVTVDDDGEEIRNAIYLTDSSGEYILDDNGKQIQAHDIEYAYIKGELNITVSMDDDGNYILNDDGDIIITEGEPEDNILLEIDSLGWNTGNPDVTNKLVYIPFLDKFVNDKVYIWERAHYYYDDGSQYVTEPIYQGSLTELLKTSTKNDSKMSSMNKWVKIDNDSITFGSTESNQTLYMDRDGIKFKEGENITSRWDNGFFHTGDILIDLNERAQFGDFAFIPRKNDDNTGGGLMFLKVGSTSTD